MMIEAAIPKYNLNQTVDYKDHHGRVQTGKIFRIEANWLYGNPVALIIYTIGHPTYRNQRCYRAERDINR